MSLNKSSFSPTWVRRSAMLVAAGALAVLGGCVVAPVDGYYDTGAPVVYPGATYYETPNYYYGGAPYYYGPSFSLGVYGNSYNGNRWRGNDHWNGNGWRGNNGHRPGRPDGWQGHGGGNGWQGGGGHRPPGGNVQPRPPRPPMPNNGLHPRPGRSFGESGMGIDRRGGTPGNP